MGEIFIAIKFAIAIADDPARIETKELLFHK